MSHFTGNLSSMQPQSRNTWHVLTFAVSENTFWRSSRVSVAMSPNLQRYYPFLELELLLVWWWWLSLSLQSVCVQSERKQKKKYRWFLFLLLSCSGGCCRSCRVAENRQVRSPSMFSLDAGKSQPRPHLCEQRGFRTGRINSFIAALSGSGEAGGGGEVFN